MKLVASVASTGYLALLAIPCAAAGASRPRLERQIPRIARMVGVRVGVTPIRALERRLGPGLVMTGGHPQGARLWRLRGRTGFLHVDGFDYDNAGEAVIDTLSLGTDSEFPRRASDARYVPRIRARCSLTALGGRIRLGMRRKAVLVAMCGERLRPMARADVLTWTSPGYSRLSPDATFRSWTLEVSFAKGRVVEIDASAGY